jgi:hypothetical protein
VHAAREITLSFPKFRVYALRRFTNGGELLWKKLYEKWELNIPYNFSVDFTRNLINNSDTCNSYGSVIVCSVDTI